MRSLIVNADDFGRSHGINEGVAVAHSRGIVTSASLMVRWPAAVEATEIGRSMPALSVGLHLDLSEWEYDQDRWLPIYEVVKATLGMSKPRFAVSSCSSALLLGETRRISIRTNTFTAPSPCARFSSNSQRSLASHSGP